MVTPSYYPIIGGTETYVQQLALKLSEWNLGVDIMTYNMSSKWAPVKREEITAENGFRVFKVSASNPRAFNFHSHSLYREIFNVHVIPRLTFSREFDKYDIIHFHDDVDLSFPMFSYLFSRGKKPRVMHCHSLDHTYFYYKKNFLPRGIFKNVADLYVALSSNSKKLLLDLGLPDSKLTILPNAVDTKVFQPKYEEKIDNLILHVGRLFPVKGLHILLESLFYVDIPVQLVAIGPFGDQQYSYRIEHLIQKLRNETLHEVIHIGPISKETLINWYQRASIFVCPSFSEPFGIVNLEALACGTPVIGTNVGGIPDIVKNGTNGILVPPNAPSALASAIKELLEDKRKRQLYGKKGREIVEKKFSWKVVMEKLVQTYDRMLIKE